MFRCLAELDHFSLYMIDDFSFVYSMAAAFGSGALFSIVSGMGTPNPVANAITTGVAFAVFQGGFFMVRTWKCLLLMEVTSLFIEFGTGFGTMLMLFPICCQVTITLAVLPLYFCTLAKKKICLINYHPSQAN